MYNVNAGGGNIKVDINNDLTNIDLTYSFTEEECVKANILKLDDIKVKGYIEKSGTDYYLSLNISGEMTLSCSITLKPVKHKFESLVEGNVKELYENNINIENSIDIFPIVWENVLVEIPMKVTASDAPKEISGEGWKLVTKVEEKENEFSKLKDLL